MRIRPMHAATSPGPRAARGGSCDRDRAARRSGLLASILLITLTLAGCGGSGGGSGSDSPARALAVQAVDLPPGQTVATVAWEPSEGPVSGYLVYVSRNGGTYTFDRFVPVASAQIQGVAGDSVRITVVATTWLQDVSESSPPSPPIRFHAAASAAVARAPSGGGSPTAAPAAPGDPVAATGEEASPTDADAEALEAEEVANEGEEPTLDLAARAIREQLLGGEPRLPLSPSSTEATRWLQDQVDVEVAAGVSLVATGHRDADGLRELVWRDAAGQIFLSNGETLASGEAPAATLEPAIRLHPTERLVALRDLDGDGLGEWLLIDDATDELWRGDGATDALLAVPSPEGARLVGVGDFDGDQVVELLWLSDDGALERTNGAGVETAAQILAPATPDDLTILAIADLDGDGRDDLLCRDDQARLVTAHTRGAAGDALGLAWSAGPRDSLLDRELLGTLDLDGDGRAEIAWLTRETVEVWDAHRLEQDTAAE